MVKTPALLHVGPYNVDQFASALATTLLLQVGIGNVTLHMVFNDLGHEPIDCPAYRHNLMQDLAAAFLGIKRTL